MRHFIKLISILLSVILLTTLSSGCGSRSKEREDAANELYTSSDEEIPEAEGNPDEEAVTSSFALCYSRDDSFNPYRCKTNLNALMLGLVFDGLVKVSTEFEYELNMASRIELIDDTIVVQLLPGIVFSDGTPIHPVDIVYSFNSAKESGSRFRASLTPITSCSFDGAKIMFKLRERDANAIKLLDFPIIKSNSDSGSKLPLGSGRYVYVSDPQKGTYLESNRFWYGVSGGGKMGIDKILLLRLPSLETVIESVQIGTVSWYYTDLARGYPTKVSAAAKLVDLNQLVFIGMNTYHNLLSRIEFRFALYNCLTRSDIVTKAYNGRGAEATSPYTPSWTESAEFIPSLPPGAKKAAESDLTKLGYVNIGQDGIRSNGNQRLSLNLIVNEENVQKVAAAELIAEQAKGIGIEILVEPVDFDTYVSRISNGNYQLYLGEYAISNNMDITPLISANPPLLPPQQRPHTDGDNDDQSPLSAATRYYTGPSPAGTLSALASYKNGDGDVKDVINAFMTELPFVPVCFRFGLSCYSRTVKGDIKSTKNDPLYNIQDWSMGG